MFEDDDLDDMVEDPPPPAPASPPPFRPLLNSTTNMSNTSITPATSGTPATGSPRASPPPCASPPRRPPTTQRSMFSPATQGEEWASPGGYKESSSPPSIPLHTSPPPLPQPPGSRNNHPPPPSSTQRSMFSPIPRTSVTPKITLSSSSASSTDTLGNIARPPFSLLLPKPPSSSSLLPRPPSSSCIRPPSSSAMRPPSSTQRSMFSPTSQGREEVPPPGPSLRPSPSPPVGARRLFPGPAGLLHPSGSSQGGEETVWAPKGAGEGGRVGVEVGEQLASSPTWRRAKLELREMLGEVGEGRGTAWVKARGREVGASTRRIPVFLCSLHSLDLTTTDPLCRVGDEEGEVEASLHREVLEHHRHLLLPQAVLLLRDVAVLFTTRAQYLNITTSNLVAVYHGERVTRLQPSPPSPLFGGSPATTSSPYPFALTSNPSQRTQPFLQPTQPSQPFFQSSQPSMQSRHNPQPPSRPDPLDVRGPASLGTSYPAPSLPDTYHLDTSQLPVRAPSTNPSSAPSSAPPTPFTFKSRLAAPSQARRTPAPSQRLIDSLMEDLDDSMFGDDF